MLSSKSREKKKVDQKEQSRFCKELNPSLGCTTCKYGPYTVIYGQNLKYGTGYTAYRGYGVYTVIRFGPTLYIRHFWQGNHHTYGHIRCVYTVLANPVRLLHHQGAV